MLRLLKEKESINVVNDQYGCPTYAADLAEVIMTIVEKQNDEHSSSGIFNYCNEGVISWFDFAKEIKKFIKSKCKINPITSAEYPTSAKRPQYSVLDTTKIKETFGIVIPDWQDSLRTCLSFLT